MEERKNFQTAGAEKPLIRTTLPVEEEKTSSPLLAETEVKTVEESASLFETELQDLRKKEKEIPLPAAYRIGRDLGINIKDVQEYIFGGRTDAEALKELGFNRLYFRAFIVGTRKELYEQSYYYGHTKAFTGMATEEKVVVKDEVRDDLGNIIQEAKKDNYALIIVRVNKICRAGFGVEEVSARMRKSMGKLIDCLDHIYIRTGLFEGEKLCISRGFKADPKDGSLSFKIELHPIFCKGITSNYTPLPQGWIKELYSVVPRITVEHYELADYLTIHRTDDNGEPRVLTLTIQQIVDLLWTKGDPEKENGKKEKMNEYQKDKGRAEEKIMRLFEDMVKARILLSFEAIRDNKGRIASIRFTLNPNFVSEKERREERKLIAERGGTNCGKKRQKGVTNAEKKSKRG